MKTTTDFQLIDVNKLIPYVNNARTHSPEQITKLRSSLREFGFVNPIIIDRDYNVIAGHGRLEAAKAEHMTEVPCVFVDHLTDAQKKAYILADNRMALDAGWDEDLLAVEMEELQNLGFDLGLTGFDEKELADLFAADERRLDVYEGCPTFYYKTEMEVTVNRRKIKAFVYIMHENRPLGIPSSSYVRTCVQGYRDFEFDLKYLRLAFDISERGARYEK